MLVVAGLLFMLRVRHGAVINGAFDLSVLRLGEHRLQSRGRHKTCVGVS